MALETAQLSPRIGSAIKADAALLLSGKHAARIRALLEERAVLVFREIDFDDDELRAFASTIGTINPEGHEGIFTVSMDKEVNDKAVYMKGTFAWHVDRVDTDLPPLGSMLTPRVLPPWGGETEFANTTAAYVDLPDDEKVRLDKLRVRHRIAAQYRGLVTDVTPEEAEVWNSNPPKVHPLVWHHRSGRRSLVLGRTAESVEGLSQEEGEALLARLMAWSAKPEYVYRHHWRMGDLVIWDNTGAMHRVREFDRTSGRRLHRVTLVGEEPIAGV